MEGLALRRFVGRHLRRREEKHQILAKSAQDQRGAHGERCHAELETMRKDGSLIQCACVWGSISNAAAGMGRFVPDCYGVSPWAIFVRRDSRIRKPEDLKDVPVSVGMRAGSHFNVPYRLEKYLPLEHIKTVNTGGFGARFLGVGANADYRRDTVTVFLRAVSVQSGEVLKSVNVSKTIYSAALQGGAFRFVDVARAAAEHPPHIHERDESEPNDIGKHDGATRRRWQCAARRRAGRPGGSRRRRPGPGRRRSRGCAVRR